MPHSASCAGTGWSLRGRLPRVAGVVQKLDAFARQSTSRPRQVRMAARSEMRCHERDKCEAQEAKDVPTQRASGDEIEIEIGPLRLV